MVFSALKVIGSVGVARAVENRNGKDITSQARRDPEGSRRLRLLEFQTVGI
jgi:hypothetical protein